jgi:hypothetical protein
MDWVNGAKVAKTEVVMHRVHLDQTGAGLFEFQ